MPNESDQARALKNSLIKQGFYCIKTHQAGMTERGTPDLLCCVGGYFVGIEVKMKRGRTLLYSDHQKLHLTNIRVAGGIGIGAVYDEGRPAGERWAVDETTTGETDHLTWCSLAGITENVRLLPVKNGMTTQVPQAGSRLGQTGR